MQSYIAATHGSAYDQNAPFEMFNDFTFNAAPMLFDAVYQGVTGTYGTGNAKNPAQTGMGLPYKYTAPSRWLGSAKSLLPGYEFVAPWSDNNPGLTGDQNLDAVFDILVGKGFGESTRLGNLKKNITNKIKTDFNKYIIPYRELQNANTVRSFLYNPIQFNKAYREKLKFQKMIDKYPSFKENIDLEPITYIKSSYGKPYDYFKIGTLKAGESLSEFIDNIQSQKYKKLIDSNSIVANLGYSNNSKLFGGNTSGLFYPDNNTTLVYPGSPYNSASTLLHEGYSHVTDNKISPSTRYHYDLSGVLLPDAIKESKNWNESRATLNELAYKIWLDSKKPDISMFYEAVNNLTDDQLLNELEGINAYGADYTKGIKALSANDKSRAIGKIRTVLKFLPSFSAPFMLRKPNNQNDK